MIKLILVLFPLFVYAEDLKSLLEYAHKNSDLVVSKTLIQKSKAKDIESKQSAYYPTIDVGAAYQSLDEKTPSLAGDIYNGFAKISFDIYDGGNKSALLSKSKNEYKASTFDSESTKKSLSLEIVQNFFNIKSLESSLEARAEAGVSLNEQLNRMKRFVSARVATQDDVDRLQASYDTNIYEMESLKLQISILRKSLELKVGKEIDKLEKSSFSEFNERNIELIDSVKSLISQKDALVDGADSLDSIYYPKLKIEDTYSAYGYERLDTIHPKGVDNQNKLLVSLNMRLFDNATVGKSKEALMISSQALESQIAYYKKEQQMQYELAMVRIQTSKIKIKSSSSALVSATSAYKTIAKKYEAGIVDNVTYLDALTAQTSAKALYETSLNDLEVAYAIYYFYAGKNIGDYL